MNFFSLFKRNLIFKFKKKTLIDNDDFKFNTIDDLFYYYGSDKSEKIKSTNEQGHGFSKYYSKYLENFKNNKNNILEIGSFSGASAASFSRYLPNSKIFCFDVNISNFKFYSKNIYVHGLDISNTNRAEITLKKIFTKHNFNFFDIIIDDGSHNLSDILISLNLFFKYLKKGGLFVIEDFKFPNYYPYNKDVNEILIDELLKKIQEKEYFNSKFINKKTQDVFFNSFDSINILKGNLPISDICFIKKK